MKLKYFFVCVDVLCTLVLMDLSGFCVTWTSSSASWLSVHEALVVVEILYEVCFKHTTIVV